MTVTESPSVAAPIAAPDHTAPRARKHWIDDWRPEDEQFWADKGAAIAKRNLIFSILSEHIGFSIWTMWSVFVLFMGPDYGFDAGQKFLLTTMPAAVGSIMRLPYTFAVAKFGGRNWSVFAASILLVPSVLAAIFLKPGTSFGTMVAVATVAGVGGGNFSSSMSNIDRFYPQRLKGWALGLNAGGGNLGVAVVQLVGLAVYAIAGAARPRLILAVYIPLIVIATLCASLFMDNLTHASNEKRAMRDVAKVGHTWIISFLYIGTFGSFIGLGFAFGQVLTNEFKDTFDTAVKATYLTFLGPLLGSLIRPVGGRLADKYGGSRISAINFALMALGGVAVYFAAVAHSLPFYVASFIVLFVLTGVGNGSVYKMIPAIFRAKAGLAVHAGADPVDAQRESRRLSAALVGLAGAIGAFGGVLVNLALRQSYLSTKSFNSAYAIFTAFYVVCLIVTWAVYIRPSKRKLDGV